MVEADVVLAKVATIDRCLSRIGDVRARRDQLLPLDVEELTLLNLQRATQAAIDLAGHVVTTEGYGLPDSVAGAFTLLEQNGVIDAVLAAELRRMVGFRNVAVHAYRAIDAAVVERIVGAHLGELRQFASRVVAHFGLTA